MTADQTAARIRNRRRHRFYWTTIMTPQERTELEARLKLAASAEQRVKRLCDAVQQLETGRVPRVCIPLDQANAGELLFSETTDTSSHNWKWQRVCWSPEETNLAAEIRAAVLEILARRLDEARAQLDDA